MNYIRHLNAFFTLISTDTRLSASHISLYMALFQYWNFNRFQNPFPIYRINMMKQSKIGSKNTYHKCIKELHQARYIIYHKPISKFQPVRISIVRLDRKEVQSTGNQLTFFTQSEKASLNPTTTSSTKPGLPPLVGDQEEEKEENPCPNNDTYSVPILTDASTNIDTDNVPNLTDTCPNFDTDNVPNLTDACTDFDTVPVPKMGQSLKHKHINIIKEREESSLAQKIFSKNNLIQEGINKIAGVPNSVHDELPRASPRGVKKEDVESFFHQNNYPATEAQKFYNHYQSNGWLVGGKTPMKDWNSSAHKWMLNADKFETKKQNETPAPKNDMESLYKLFLAGQNIFKHITPDHFNELKLELTEAIMQYARKERINQLTGSNQNSILQLMQAYLANNKNDALLLMDKTNLISLAKKIAVLNHFQIQKQNGTTSLSSRT